MALARALIRIRHGGARLLILDEPTAGLDVTARRDFWEAMHQQAERGRTIVFATHYLEEAQNFADRIVLIAKGHIIADGTVDQIRALTSHRHVTALLPVDRADTLVAELRPLLDRNTTLEESYAFVSLWPLNSQMESL